MNDREWGQVGERNLQFQMPRVALTVSARFRITGIPYKPLTNMRMSGGQRNLHIDDLSLTQKTLKAHRDRDTSPTVTSLRPLSGSLDRCP